MRLNYWIAIPTALVIVLVCGLLGGCSDFTPADITYSDKTKLWYRDENMKEQGENGGKITVTDKGLTIYIARGITTMCEDKEYITGGHIFYITGEELIALMSIMDKKIDRKLKELKWKE